VQAEPTPLSPRRFGLGCAAGGLLAALAFFWMVTDGTGQLFQSGLNADFYDVQARALLAGHWWMPPGVLSIEGIVEHGRTFMYYGPFPALLRMPILLVTHSLDGRLTGLSMTVAFALAVVFVGRLSWKVRLLADGATPVTSLEAVVAGAVVFVACAGGALFFLASDMIIYHEAELWGATLALGAFDFLVGFLRLPRMRSAIGAGVLATFAMLTRGSVGAGPVVALALTCLVCLVPLVHRGRLSDALGRLTGLDGEPVRWSLLAVLATCVVVPLAAYAAVNEAKFGSMFGLPLNRQVETMISPHRRAVLAANGGSLFGLAFVPTALLAYLRPDGLTLTRLFPFVMFPGAAKVLGDLRYDDRDWASSVTATMPALSLLALGGLAAVFWPRAPSRRRQRRRGAHRAAEPATSRLVARLRIPVVGAAAGTAGVLEIAFIANRYLADLMPLVVLLGLAGVQAGYARARRARARRARAGPRIVATLAVVLLAVGGLWTNGALTLVYQRELRPAIPLTERAGFVNFQQHLDAALFGGRPEHVERVSGLRRHEPAGTLAIVGDCTGVYESTGVQSGWDAVERSAGDGRVRFLARFPDTGALYSARRPGPWWPVLSNGQVGQAAWLALRSVGRDEFQFGYLFEGAGQRFLTGPPFDPGPARRHLVDAALDRYVGQVEVFVDGTNEYELGYFVRPNRPLHVGTNPFGGPVASRFPARLQLLPVTTPICHYLARRLGVTGRPTGGR
jgi:hypothetical protein